MSAVDTSKNVGGRNSPLVEEYKVIIRELRMKNQQQGNEVCTTCENLCKIANNHFFS